MVESKESVPGPTILFSTKCRPGIQAKVKNLREDSFTLVLEQEGKVELSCEDEEGRTFNRTEWGDQFVFDQLQVFSFVRHKLSVRTSTPEPFNEHNYYSWIRLFQAPSYNWLTKSLHSPAVDGPQLFRVDQSQARGQTQGGTNTCHHIGREVWMFHNFHQFSDATQCDSFDTAEPYLLTSALQIVYFLPSCPQN